MATLGEIGVLVSAVMATVGVVIGIINFRDRRKVEKTTFRFFRRNEPASDPIPSKVALVFTYNSNPIEKCRVLYDGKPLPCRKTKDDGLRYDEYVYAYGGATFRIPENKENEDAIVVLMNGDNRLQQPMRLRDLPSE